MVQGDASAHCLFSEAHWDEREHIRQAKGIASLGRGQAVLEPRYTGLFG